MVDIILLDEWGKWDNELKGLSPNDTVMAKKLGLKFSSDSKLF